MINTKEEKFLNNLINKYRKIASNKKISYSLLENAFSNADIISGIKVLLSKKITMSSITEKFENEFAKFIGSKYALMVNSGSSANLISVFALINPKKKNRLRPGNEFMIPSLCWSTSLWPIVQAGLTPRFIDIDKKTLNISIDEIKKKFNSKTKAIMGIHVLGNSTNMNELSSFIKKKNLFLIEDTCESLGAKYNGKHLGTFGDFGTYSFYYSHQITSGEGGMIVCNSKDDYKIIHALRSHGWDRGLGNNKKNFNFINSGFNLRPTEIVAAIGYSQFKRLNKFKNVRSINRKKIIDRLKNSIHWKNQFTFIDPIKKLEPSWFGLPILIDKKISHKKDKFLNFLNNKEIETRPIISGNFINQPCVKLFNLNKKREKFKNTQEIDDRGFFVGLHTTPITDKQLNFIEKNFFKIDEF